MAAWIDKARSSPNCFITVLHFSQMRMGFESVGFKASFAPSDAMIAAPVLPIGDRERPPTLRVRCVALYRSPLP
jgi:hypothetical protein